MNKQWVCLLAFLAIGHAQAASFDCAKAGTKVEKLVCANAELSKLDDQLSAAYKDGAKHTAEPDRYKREQRSWLKGRETCLNDADKATTCLRELYSQRVQALSGNCWRHKSWISGMANGSYTVSGKNWPMCRIMLENLNRFCGEAPKPGEYYELKLDPAITSLKFPDWQPIDPKAHFSWFEDYVKWQYGTQRGPDEIGWSMLKPEIQRRLDQGLVHMWEARFDLTNDGLSERVIKMDLGGHATVFVVGPDGANYGMASSNVGMVNERSGMLDKRHHATRNVVINAGKTYTLHDEVDELRLTEPFTVPYVSPQGKQIPSSENTTYGRDTVCMFERTTN